MAHHASQMMQQAEEWEQLARRHAAELAAVEEVRGATRREHDEAMREARAALERSEAARAESERLNSSLKEQLQELQQQQERQRLRDEEQEQLRQQQQQEQPNPNPNPNPNS